MEQLADGAESTAGLKDRRLALGYLELGVKLNGELGRRATEDAEVSAIVVGAGAEAIAAWRTDAARINPLDEPL